MHMSRSIERDDLRQGVEVRIAPLRRAAEAPVVAAEKYYPAFDYLRLILVLVVAAVHFKLIGSVQVGNYTVQVFFALSGWLIGGILLRSEAKDLPRFYFNRAARIWIPYFLAVFLLIGASLLKDQITAKWLEIFFYDGTFVYNLFGTPQLAAYVDAMPLKGSGGHFWTICAEEQFYQLAPLLITLLPSRIGKSLWFWCLITIAVLASPYWESFGAISLGVLSSLMRSNFGDWHLSRRARVALAAVVVLGFAAGFTGLSGYRTGAPISAACLVLFLARAGRHSKIATFIGGVSFPMYLNHWIGIFVANGVFGLVGMRESWMCGLTALLLAFVVGAIFFLAVDSNIRKNRELYFTVSRGKILTCSGFALVAIGLAVGFYLVVATAGTPAHAPP